MTTAATRLVVLLGHPVDHSASPALHSAAFAAAGIDAAYLACDVAPERLTDALTGLAVLGALGANVTVPHKAAALALADTASAEADAVGAANTLVRRGTAWHADNTDAEGLGDVLDRDVRIAPGDAVRLIGAGGAARAAAVALGRRGAHVEVVARRRDAAAAVAALAAAHGAASASGSDTAGASAPRLVVNATPLGLGGESLPDGLGHVGPGQVALDLVYGAQATPFVAGARAAGAEAWDGRGMLLAQAARAFTLWTGAPAPIAAMAAALTQALDAAPRAD